MANSLPGPDYAQHGITAVTNARKLKFAMMMTTIAIVAAIIGTIIEVVQSGWNAGELVPNAVMLLSMAVVYCTLNRAIPKPN